MRTPDEAILQILRRVGRDCPAPATLRTELVPIAEADGRVLARDVASDLDLPPFEKSAMDGFAVRSADFVGAPGSVALRLVGESRAGAPFTGAVPPGACIELYTGAEVPRDCDAVVMVERSRREGERVLLDGGAQPGQNVCHRGEDLREGAVVLRAGRRLSPIDLAVLASVGCEPVPVFARPRVTLLTTGDELVEPSVRPGPGEIREGNTRYLAARARRAHAVVTNLGVVRDDERALAERIGRAFEASDVVITTGGVSMGRYDLVGAVLERLGVEPVFHKVAIKPGKPLWFGMRGPVPVFALPGNPVSCLIGFEVFVRPALARLEGAEDETAARLRIGRWLGAPTSENPRQQNLPVRVRAGADGVDELEPLRWRSSADIVGLTLAQGLAVVEAGAVLRTGELARYRPLGDGA
ncbi:MAG: gephyrin-like molybdotransferase Glp [Planctomycetota bacterium]